MARLYLLMAVWILTAAMLTSCASSQQPVVQKLDEFTAVTITHSRTPMILSPHATFNPDAATEFLQVGAIEVNRMGALRYYIWLGITDETIRRNADKQPGSFESIVFTAGQNEFGVDVLGWTQAAIGTSEPVYKKLFRTSLDAYYEVSLEQIRLLTESDSIKVRTSGNAARSYELWYRPTTARDDLAGFVRAVSQ